MVALDNPGYGFSENPNRSITTDDVADAFVEAADALGITGFVAIGSLMGNFACVSLASRYPGRVKACICANLFHYPPKKEPATASSQGSDGKPVPDPFELKEDGSHLLDLHNKRSQWLDPELNFRVLQTEISYLTNRRARYANGIYIQDLSQYDFESSASLVECPVLCIRGDEFISFFDAIGLGGTKQFESGVGLLRPDVEVRALSGEKSTLNMINQIPDEFASACSEYLESKNI